MDKFKTPSSDNVRYRTKKTGRAESARSRSSRRRKDTKLDAARLIELLRRHSTLTLMVCVVIISLLTGYVAIELGA
ncbi:hypothetical protein [Limnohabitans sp. Jir72]|uniref:hypothetical protein n=1 Tax=Limnohabitans sp. Jir72 TaxID=1977909 RepID=UPI000D3AC8D4|nr:hypothetical protein [Limnohabitans sp. Jir72]PUE28104.1 hypothetical protein B9Z52_14620 [Limnohabitans sp. Jir72]